MKNKNIADIPTKYSVPLLRTMCLEAIDKIPEEWTKSLSYETAPDFWVLDVFTTEMDYCAEHRWDVKGCDFIIGILPLWIETEINVCTDFHLLWNLWILSNAASNFSASL